MSKVFIVSVLLYLVGVLGVGLYGEFPINDDWLFVRQVQWFNQGHAELNAKIDPSFVGQLVLGSGWSRIFGDSFLSFRVLTVIMTILGMYGLYKIFGHFKLSARESFFLLLVYAFNPIVFTSSFTFMTEAYFMCFFIWALYFGVKKRFTLFGIFTGFSVLVRQLGVFLVVPLFISFQKEVKKMLFGLMIVGLAIFVWYSWPKYGDGGLGLIEPKYVWDRIKIFWMIIPALVFWVSPILLSYIKDKKTWLLGVVAVPLLLKFDVLPLGSVFYLESLYSKTDFRTNLSLFDNTLFKVVVAYIVGVAFISLLTNVKKFLDNKYLIANLLLFTGLLLLASDLYDRYLVIVFVLCLLIMRVGELTRASYVALGLLMLLSVVNNYEFMTMQRLKYAQVQKLQAATGLKNQIYLDGVYEKYTKAVDVGDYQGVQNYRGGEDLCYVQEYTLGDAPFPIRLFVDANPRVYDRRKLEIKRIKKHLDELIFNDEYFSLVYSTIGKRAFVGSWCEPEVPLANLP